MSWLKSAYIYSSIWQHQAVFANKDAASIYKKLFKIDPLYTTDIGTLQQTVDDLNNISIVEVSLHPFNNYSFTQWQYACIELIALLVKISPVFHIRLLWTREQFLSTSIWLQCVPALAAVLPKGWSVKRNRVCSSSGGDTIHADIVFFVVVKTTYCENNLYPSSDIIDHIPSAAEAIVVHSPDPHSITTITVSIAYNAVKYDTIDNQPRVLAVLLENGQSMQRSHAPNYIMDTGFPIVEPCAREYYTEYFERWPGLCCGDTHRETIIGRSISNIELLS